MAKNTKLKKFLITEKDLAEHGKKTCFKKGYADAINTVLKYIK